METLHNWRKYDTSMNNNLLTATTHINNNYTFSSTTPVSKKYRWPAVEGGKVLPLVYDGDPLLSQISEPYDLKKETLADTNQLYLDMSASMRYYDGIGLAGVQVGVLKRVFVMEIGEKLPLFFINPRIVSQDGDIKLSEGCLSFPKIVVDVDRPKEVHVRFTTISGEIVTRRFAGTSAHVVSHEIDHLDGITMKNRVTKLRWDLALKKAKK